MRKSIYSLVLPEELVAGIDLQAQAKNRSRSQFIEEILAGHLSLNTPQTSVNRLLEDIYEELGRESGLEMLARNKGNAIQMRASLRYKYSPKVKYIFDVKSRRNAFDGLLKIIPRTQSDSFMNLLVKFFDELNVYERASLQDLPSRQVALWEPLSRNGYSFDGSRFMKPILMGDMKSPGDEEASKRVSAYIRCVHDAIDLFFKLHENPQTADLDEDAWRESLKLSLSECYSRYGIR